jgi:hypothetical protein
MLWCKGEERELRVVKRLVSVSTLFASESALYSKNKTDSVHKVYKIDQV